MAGDKENTSIDYEKVAQLAAATAQTHADLIRQLPLCSSTGQSSPGPAELVLRAAQQIQAVIDSRKTS